MRDRELRYPVSLTDAHGRFSREAHGWVTNRSFGRTRFAPGSRWARLPGNLEGTVATLRIEQVRVTVEEVEGGTRIRADGGGSPST